jgi:hypothetical protein
MAFNGMIFINSSLKICLGKKFVFGYIYIYIYIHMCVCVCVCVYVLFVFMALYHMFIK